MAADCPIENTANWPVVSLKQITTKIGSGATPRGGSETYLPARVNYALIRSQNVFDRRLDQNGLAYITDEQAGALRGVALQKGDVLLNITGDGITFGRSCMVSENALPACVNQHVSIIRVDPTMANPGYVMSFLTHPDVKTYIEAFDAGGSRRAITKGHIESFKLPLPPLHEQDAITHILGTLDDKIELNRKQNETLEAMAQTLFKAWFVNFEPVRAKMEGRWQRGESLLGLPAHLYDLFPDRLVDSELGEIPENWEMRSLDSIANYLNGLALQKFPPESEYEFLPVIKIAQLRAGNTNGADRASARIKPEYVVVDGDVLFSWSGSLEVEVWNGGSGALNQHLFKVTSDKVPKWFYFFATRHHLQSFRAIAADKATTMGHIQRMHLTNAKIAVAPLGTMKNFDVVIAPLFDQLVSNSQQSHSLSQLRDTLLPKLISGELRVPDVERIVGAAT